MLVLLFYKIIPIIFVIFDKICRLLKSNIKIETINVICLGPWNIRKIIFSLLIHFRSYLHFI